MKKLFIMALMACVAIGVQAGEGDADKKGEGKNKPKPVTKEMFVANQKKMAEKKGVDFDQAAAEAKFKKMDKNKDGKLTGAEVPKKKGKEKEQVEGKAQDEAASAAPAQAKKGEPKPVTQEMFVARQKKMAEKKGVEFDQAAAEAKFKKMDKNKDGKLTADEMPKRKGKKEKGEGKAKGQNEEATTDSED